MKKARKRNFAKVIEMEIKKLNESVYLLKNEKGEYHLSSEKFNELGKEKAIKFAKSEINKKLKSTYQEIDIDFARARRLGFCEYGIKEFCDELNLDINKTYSINFIESKLTVDVFLSYPDECSKLFGKDNIIKKFGGIKKMLSENRNRKMLNFVFNSGVIPDKKLHLLACDFAEKALPHFEEKYPEDKRPRNAIEVKRLWIEEEYKNEQIR